VRENKVADAKARIVDSWDKNKKLLKDAQAGDVAAMQTLGESGRATINPVTGEVARVYALCARMNPAGQCLMFEPSAPPKGGGS